MRRKNMSNNNGINDFNDHKTKVLISYCLKSPREEKAIEKRKKLAGETDKFSYNNSLSFHWHQLQTRHFLQFTMNRESPEQASLSRLAIDNESLWMHLNLIYVMQLSLKNKEKKSVASTLTSTVFESHLKFCFMDYSNDFLFQFRSWKHFPKR